VNPATLPDEGQIRSALVTLGVRERFAAAYAHRIALDLEAGAILEAEAPEPGLLDTVAHEHRIARLHKLGRDCATAPMAQQTAPGQAPAEPTAANLAWIARELGLDSEADLGADDLQSIGEGCRERMREGGGSWPASSCSWRWPSSRGRRTPWQSSQPPPAPAAPWSETRRGPKGAMKMREKEVTGRELQAFKIGYRAGHDNALGVDFDDVDTDTEADKAIDWVAIVDWAERILGQRGRIDRSGFSEPARALAEARDHELEELARLLRAKRDRMHARGLAREAVRAMLARGRLN